MFIENGLRDGVTGKAYKCELQDLGNISDSALNARICLLLILNLDSIDRCWLSLSSWFDKMRMEEQRRRAAVLCAQLTSVQISSIQLSSPLSSWMKKCDEESSRWLLESWNTTLKKECLNVLKLRQQMKSQLILRPAPSPCMHSFDGVRWVTWVKALISTQIRATICRHALSSMYWWSQSSSKFGMLKKAKLKRI